VIGKGSISSLKRFKEDVKEVEKGYECGIGIDGISDFQPNDVIEAFVIEKHARRLES
jgi:translation initiation factor IF-2